MNNCEIMFRGKIFTISLLILANFLVAQKGNFVLLRQVGKMDKSMHPILIIRDTLTKRDSSLIIKLTRIPTFFKRQEHIYKYEANAFNLFDTVMVAKITKRPIDYKKGALKICRGRKGKIVQDLEIQWGDASIKHLQRVTGLLGVAGGYDKLITDLEETVCLMRGAKYPCE